MKDKYLKPTIKSQKVVINQFYQNAPFSGPEPPALAPIRQEGRLLAALTCCEGRLWGPCLGCLE